MTAAGNKFIAGTTGSGSAISVSGDGGRNWSQSGFVDDDIFSVVDMAVSPKGTEIYLLTFSNSSTHSLWRSTDEGLSWRRIVSTGDFGLTVIELMSVANDGTLYVAGPTASSQICLRSTDAGLTFTALTLSSAVDSTSGFASVDSRQFFYTSLDTFARVWRTADGITFDNTNVSGAALTDLELSPGFASDKTMIAGAVDGNIYLSTDGAVTFSALQKPSLTGDLYLAFAPDFATSKYIYAASSTAGAGIWRLKVGETIWTRVDSGFPPGTIISGLSVSADGIIYAATANQVSATFGGLERKTPANAAWDVARDGLASGATLWGLDQRGNKLYSLDTTGNRIVSYTDTLASPVALTSPADKAQGLGIYTAPSTGGIDLVWRNPGGATTYAWQVASNADMSSIKFEGTSTTETTRLTNLDPGATYYWRIRATAPLQGPWSVARSFSAALANVQLIVPGAGASNIPVNTIFQWVPVTGATNYEISVSLDAGFGIIASSATVTGNAWQPATALVPSSTYYWRVRAVSASSSSAWRAISAFTTAATPAPTTTQPPATTTVTQPAPTVTVTTSTPDWVILVVIGFGAMIIVLLVVVIVVVRGKKGL